MGRTNNIGCLHYTAFSWAADSLVVIFVTTKTDTTSTKAEETAKHIYANPLNPAICPILALGLYTFVNGYNMDGFVFQNHAAATDRFGKNLGIILSYLKISEEVLEAVIADIASHSGRKVFYEYCMAYK